MHDRAWKTYVPGLVVALSLPLTFQELDLSYIFRKTVKYAVNVV